MLLIFYDCDNCSERIVTNQLLQTNTKARLGETMKVLLTKFGLRANKKYDWLELHTNKNFVNNTDSRNLASIIVCSYQFFRYSYHNHIRKEQQLAPSKLMKRKILKLVFTSFYK